MSRDLTVIFAERTELPEPLLASKKTSSAEVGTGTSLAQPEQTAQLVGPVASQLVDDPPPTQ